MIKPTLDQKQKRYLVIPGILQEALFSEESANVIGTILKDNNIPNKQAGDISSVTGLVLLGFLRISDVAQELQERTGLDINICKKISASLENKIFNSIRADLEKIYAPADSGPVKIEEIRSGGPPKPTGGAESRPEKGLLTAPSAPVPQFTRPSFIKDTHGAPLPEPKPLGDLIKSATPSSTAPSAPIPPIISGKTPAVPAPSVPATPINRPPLVGAAAPMSGLGAKFQGKTISPAPTSLPSQAPLRPAMSAAPKLNVRFGSATGGEINKLGTSMPAGGGAVKIEIGSIKPSSPNSGLNMPAPAKEQMAQKIVHYSQWKTPVLPPTPNSTPEQKAPIPLQHVISGQNVAPAQSNTIGSKLPPPPPPPLRK